MSFPQCLLINLPFSTREILGTIKSIFNIEKNIKLKLFALFIKLIYKINKNPSNLNMPKKFILDSKTSKLFEMKRAYIFTKVSF